jgi:hypothetical protein
VQTALSFKLLEHDLHVDGHDIHLVDATFKNIFVGQTQFAVTFILIESWQIEHTGLLRASEWQAAQVAGHFKHAVFWLLAK